MKITILQGAFLPVPPLYGGAVEKLWFELGKQFASLGIDVVHISRAHCELPDDQVIEGVNHIRIPGFEMPANILITNTFWMPILRRFTSPKTGLLVISVERMPKGQIKLYSNAAVLRCCSESVRDRVLHEQPLLAPKTVVIPNPLPFDISTITSQPNKQPTILYCGRIHPEKGLELLIQAFAKACQLGLCGWTLRIVGPAEVSHGGGGRDWLRSLQELSLVANTPIQWIGPLYDNDLLHAEYMNASLFVYPSLALQGEAMPIAPLEAMSYGAVPIVSALPCFGQYIKDGFNGFVFNQMSSDSVSILAGLFVELASDPDRLRKLSIQASRVRETHAPHVIAHAFHQLFMQLIVGHSQ